MIVSSAPKPLQNNFVSPPVKKGSLYNLSSINYIFIENNHKNAPPLEYNSNFPNVQQYSYKFQIHSNFLEKSTKSIDCSKQYFRQSA